MNKPRILFSIPTRHHIEIALDELEGLQDMGFACGQFPYAAREGVQSKLGRLWVIINNAFRLVNTARRFKPDVVYLNSRLEVLAGMRDFLTIAIFKTLYKGRVKFFIKSHGSDVDVLNISQGFFGKVVMPYLKQNVSAWLFLSTEEKSAVQKSGYISPDRVFVTKNIVRTDQFNTDASFKSKMGIPQANQILLFVGRIIKEKGIYEVVKAFAQLTDDPNLTLIIVGDGSELNNLKSLANSLKITERIIFTGFIPEKEVVQFYANCDILVFPTFFPEGFPMALFNSVAAGMAVVTTPTRAATDFLSEPENCIWVKPQNFNNVSAAIQRLMASDKLMQSMKKNNVSKGAAFAKKQVAAELADILKQIVQ